MSVLDIYLQQLQVGSMQTCFVSIHVFTILLCDALKYTRLMVSLACDDNRAGQPDRAVVVCPAFVVCKQCVLDPVSRDTIHFSSLQCCDLHADAMIPCCQYGLC